MVRRLICWLMLTAVVVGLDTGLASTGVTAQEDTTTAVITSPVEGQQLFGLVTITGSAGHATAFESYTLEYKDLSDPNSPWLLAQERVRQQVTAGVLGAWNTNVVPDGTYSLRLRVFLQDSQVGGEFIVTGLRIVNSAPTPVPTPASGAGDSQPITATPGPTPTSPIQQPPSNSPMTPNTITGLGIDASNTGDTSSLTNTRSDPAASTRVNTGRVRGAFCAGAYLALGIFAVMLAYVALRGRFQPYTRRILWQDQNDHDRDY